MNIKTRETASLTLALLLAGIPAAIQTAKANSPRSDNTAVAAGTRFLVRLEDGLNTGKHKPGKRFKAKTMEALETPDGMVLPAGAEIRGHVSRVEPAGLTGRARMWLSFDEMKSPYGKLPVVAHVVSVPGERSVKSGDSREGEIEARTSKGRPELEAAAAGAAIGAVVGAATRGGKGAAIGAAIGGAGGFLIASGMAQELNLMKGTKLELELDRALTIPKR